VRLLLDPLNRSLEVPEHPLRIVSLVPSVTELVFELGAGDRVVGVSRYCSQPDDGGLDGKARVGGQKDPDLDAICALSPDLVLAVKEENLRRDVEELGARGVAVYVADVRTVAAARALVGELCDLCDGSAAAAATISSEIGEAIDGARAIAASHPAVPVFCPVWRDPWISIGPGTYMFDLLRLAGAIPVPPAPATEQRYPKVSLSAVRAASPVLTLLPDEPYPFSAADAAELATVAPAQLVDGKLLGWYGRRTTGIVELARRIDGAARARHRGSSPAKGSVLS